MTTSIRVPSVGLFAVLLVAACAAPAAPAATGQGSPQQPVTGTSQGSGGASSQGPSAAAGTWTGTVTRHFTQTTNETTESDTSTLTVTYDATVNFSSNEVDINAWKLSGPATIKSTQSSDYQYHVTSTVGTCNKHYHDEDIVEGTGVVDGGFGIADDATYEFNMTIPGLDTGTETAMRDETGCLGSSNTEVNPWSVAFVTVDGAGDVTDPTFITGSTSKPIANGGRDTVTWTFHLSQ